MSGYIDDAGNGGEKSDSYLGNPDTIFHGQNDEYTQKLDAKMIEKLTPVERLKMGAEMGPAPRVKVETGEQKMAEDKRRFVPAPLVRPLPEAEKLKSSNGLFTAIVVIAIILALLAFAALARGGEILAGNSAEIPVKSSVSAPAPAPNTP